MPTLLDVVIGDVSGDGHDKTKKFTVIVEGDFSEQMLADNFDRNAAYFGYEPELFAAEYEESTVDHNFLIALLRAGMPASQPGLKSWQELFGVKSTGKALPDDPAAAIAILENEEEEVTLTTNGYLQILMFLMGYNLSGYGLDGFVWREQKAKDFLPMTKTVGYNHVGYGLFY